jgi:signal transduction histidine kinase
VSFRFRIFVATLLLVLVPLVFLVVGIRREMSERLRAQYAGRVKTLMTVIKDDLDERSREMGESLEALKVRIADDNEFRLGAVDELDRARPYLLDYAGRTMSLMGLSMLQIQDGKGRILSSGHFRNEYDRLERSLPRTLRRAASHTALVQARRPEGNYLVLARAEDFELAGKSFSVVGGREVDRRFLTSMARGEDLAVSLVYPGGAISSDDSLEVRLNALNTVATDPDSAWTAAVPLTRYAVETLDEPFVVEGEGGGIATAHILVSYRLQPLQDILDSLDLWLKGVLLASVLGSLILAVWFSAAISNPIVDLARRTERIDLEHLDADFSSRRRDEVGTLSRFLAAMIERLRTSAEQLRDAERRVTQGEIARQVNHDIHNGLTSLRNIFRHFSQVADEEPETLASIYRDRQKEIHESMDHLEKLAAHYKRISVRGERTPLDLNDTVSRIAGSAVPGTGVDLVLDLAGDLPPVHADGVSVRRIVENLMRNAWESFNGTPGTVILATEASEDGRVRLTVSDTGPGIPPEKRDVIFEDFYTTKTTGTGLGLSIVRRLVADLGGDVDLESEPGKGTRFIVTFPPRGDDA